MTRTTPERKPCGTCGNEYTVTANGTIRHHITENPEFQDPDNPDSRKCKGAGQPPATAAGVALAEDMADTPQCRLCKHPVQLTDNGRARSHLTPEQTPRPCPGGSDFPLGTYPDMIGTTDGLVATIRAECDHVPVGQCYACYGEAGNPVSDTELNAMAEAGGTGTAPWGYEAGGTATPTMADQLKGTPLTQALARETQGVGTVLDGDTRAEAERFMDAAPETLTGGPMLRARLSTMLTEDRRTPEQKAADAETSRLTREAIKVLEQRTPEQKARMAASMDRTASAVLGLPVDPSLNHEYTDPSGTKWTHEGPAGTCQAPDCATVRQGLPEGFDPDCDKCDTDNHRCPGCGTDVRHGTVTCDDCTARVDAERQAKCTHPHGFIENDPVDDDGEGLVFRCGECGAVGTGDKPVGPDPTLPNCLHPETHRAGCGCPDDDSARREPIDGWRTPLDLMEKMPEDVRVLDALRRNCGECGHPVTPLVDHFAPDGRAARVVWDCENHLHSSNPCRGHECTPDTRVRLGDLDEGDYFLRHGTLMRLTERESSSSVMAEVMDGPHKGRTGELKNLNEVVDRAPVPDGVETHVVTDDSDDPEHVDDCPGCPDDEPKTGPVRVGELEEGNHFTRRGTLMRVKDKIGEIVIAAVVDGPHKGRTGELPNSDELVDREPCRHSYAWGDDGKFGHAGSFCQYCGAGDPATEVTKEQETKTWQPTPQTSPRSSLASVTKTATRTTAPAPGSKPPTRASAPAVSPKSQSVTPSAPTATAAGNGRSAVVTTDQQAAAAAFLGSGRPSASVTVGVANPADAAAQFLAGGSGAHGEKETKRDRYGRYLIPHPDTGKEQAWTRATTFAKSISDTYALSQWGLRMALLGATVRPDIVQRAHGKHVKADKQLLDELTADLKNAAGDKVAANLGTSMHSFTEMADRAWHSPGGPRSVMDQVPPDCRPMVETYISLLEETGLEPIPHLIEFTTVVKQYGVAGTSDNCYKVTKPLTLKIGRGEVHLVPGEYVIGDKKTGKDLDYGWQEIAIQLATYREGINTAGVWDRHTETWDPDPLKGAKVRTDAGVVIHLPVDKEAEKTPTVYGVDLESGWNAAVLCERVRAWRKVRRLASPVMVSEAETFAPARPEPTVTTRTTVRPPSLMDRAQRVTSKGEASAVWQEAAKAGLSKSEVDELVDVMQSRLKKLAEPAG